MIDFNQIFHVALAIIVVAGVTVTLASKNTSSIISAIGSTFTNSLRASMGH